VTVQIDPQLKMNQRLGFLAPNDPSCPTSHLSKSLNPDTPHGHTTMQLQHERCPLGHTTLPQCHVGPPRLPHHTQSTHKVSTMPMSALGLLRLSTNPTITLKHNYIAQNTNKGHIGLHNAFTNLQHHTKQTHKYISQ